MDEPTPQNSVKPDMFDFKRLPVPILRDLFGASVPAVWYRCETSASLSHLLGIDLQPLWSDLVYKRPRNTTMGGCVETFLNGHVHSFGDACPVAWGGHGALAWYRCGLLHRDNDLPARIGPYGTTREWYQNGERHRDNDRPAHIYTVGDFDLMKWWWVRGKRHRDNGEPAVEELNGDGVVVTKEWWVHGRRHRDGTIVVTPTNERPDCKVTIKAPVIESLSHGAQFLNGRDKLVRQTKGTTEHGATIPIIASQCYNGGYYTNFPW